MNQPSLSRSEIDEPDHVRACDVVAMLAMLDWLISRIGPIDAMSATCLVMARESLATCAPPPPRPQ
jgi:hypothetical protein